MYVSDIPSRSLKTNARVGFKGSLPDDFISRNRFFQKADFLCICDIMTILKNQNTGRNAKHPLLEEKLRARNVNPEL